MRTRPVLCSVDNGPCIHSLNFPFYFEQGKYSSRQLIIRCIMIFFAIDIYSTTTTAILVLKIGQRGDDYGGWYRTFRTIAISPMTVRQNGRDSDKTGTGRNNFTVAISPVLHVALSLCCAFCHTVASFVALSPDIYQPAHHRFYQIFIHIFVTSLGFHRW